MVQVGDIKWVRLTQVLYDFANYFIFLARENLKKNNSNATYTLDDTMEPVVEVEAYNFKVSVKIQDYWEYVEKGRKAGLKRPPIKAIMKWVLVKPVKPVVGKGKRKSNKPPTVTQLSFAIANSIKKNGIPARPFFRPAKKEAIAYYKEKIEEAIDEDVQNWLTELVENGVVFKELLNIL